jgi:hypothetical protein
MAVFAVFGDWYCKVYYDYFMSLAGTAIGRS